MTNKTEGFAQFSEWVKAGTDAIVLLKTLYPLLPQGGAEIEAKIAAAEEALQEANVELARAWGYNLHQCTFPPQIMLIEPSTQDAVCPNCNYRKITPKPTSVRRASWVEGRRG